MNPLPAGRDVAATTTATPGETAPARFSVASRVAVLGLGLIGGSMLRACRTALLPAVGFDPDPVALTAARDDGFAVAQSAEATVAAADLVVLAMPLPDVADALRSIAPALDPGAVLTDVGTLKRPVLAAVRAHAPGATFVGGHPLAGVEQTGWAAGDAALFADAPWALALDPDTRLDAWLRVAHVVCRLGARPVPTTAADQDAAVARVIGLPHVLAEALALTGLAGGPLGLSLAAGSYRSGSRVARTRPELVATWCDENPALVAALDDAIGHLQQARDALADHSSILPLARAGYEARTHWERRGVEPVAVPAQAEALLAHGARGGWLTAVTSDEDGITRLTAARPTS